MNLKTMIAAGAMAFAPLPSHAEQPYAYSAQVAGELNDTVGRCGYIIDYKYNPPEGSLQHLLFPDSDFITGANVNQDVLNGLTDEVKRVLEFEAGYTIDSPTFNPITCMEKLSALLDDSDSSDELISAINDILPTMRKQLSPFIDND